MLVRPRGEAQTIYYSLTNPKFIQACTLMCQALIEQHQAAGESLLTADLLERLIAPCATGPTHRLRTPSAFRSAVPQTCTAVI